MVARASFQRSDRPWGHFSSRTAISICPFAYRTDGEPLLAGRLYQSACQFFFGYLQKNAVLPAGDSFSTNASGFD
jgi:hypothetical protein